MDKKNIPANGGQPYNPAKPMGVPADSTTSSIKGKTSAKPAPDAYGDISPG